MKKDVTEERTFCDFCDTPAYTECLFCGKDLCSEHRMEVVIYLQYQSKPFRASLCPVDSLWLLPFLEKCWNNSTEKKSTSWAKCGQNPEFNEARLREILAFIKEKAGDECPNLTTIY